MAFSDSKTVLITGASSGLGAATALACAAAGHRVALAARRLDRLQEIADRINRPESVEVIETDVRDPEAILRMVARAEEVLGPLDALVANAGMGHSESVVECSEEHLLQQMEVNVLGVIRCVKAVLPGMLERRAGHILIVSSVAAEVPSAGSVVYGATKGAVKTFAEGLYREVSPAGIHVTDILPGYIASEMTADVKATLPPASIVGDLVVDLLECPRRRAVVPDFYGAGIWLNRLAPGLVDIGLRWLQAEADRRRK